MGPRVPFAPALLTLSLHITLHIYFISFRLFNSLYVTCVMSKKKKLLFKITKFRVKATSALIADFHMGPLYCSN